MKKLHKIACAVMGFGMLISFPAEALSKPKHKNSSPEHVFEKQADKDRGIIVIGGEDRVIIRNYLSKRYLRNCPPGLAKKNNGCLPPGQAKKYAVGSFLPPGIYRPVPGDLLSLLSPLPRGYQYVQVDQDILLISEAGKKILDAVTLMSAVN